KNIDQFFRDPSQPAVLAQVPKQMQSMRGVLAVLGLDMAGQATVRMREDVDHLLAADADIQQLATDGVFDRLAGNLGALGFLIDMLGVQPNLVKSLFKFDPDTGVLSPLMGREKAALPELANPVEVVAIQAERDQAQNAAEAVAESVTDDEVSLEDVSDELQKIADIPLVQDQPAFAESVASAQAAVVAAQSSDDVDAHALAREQVAQVMSDFAQSVAEPVELELPEVSLAHDSGYAPLIPAPAVPAEPTGFEEDDEMLGIFLEEAQEVIASAKEAIEQLLSNPGDVTLLTSVRRGFHTLKGSSRMVGLKDYGEAGWACEQLFNAWMASQEPASADLLGFAAEALAYMSGWTQAIEARAAQQWHSAPLVHAADSLRLEGRRIPIGGGSAFTAADVQSFAADEAAGAPEDELSELTLPLIDLGGEPAGDDASAEPVTQPADLSDLEVPAIDGDLLTLELPPEDEATEIDLPLLLPEVEAETSFASPVDEVADVELLEIAFEEPPAEAVVADVVVTEGDEQVKVIGPLRISIPLFNIYLNEADEQSRRLCTCLNEWSLELHRPVTDETVALAHSLAGNSATVGYSELSQLARLLEHSLMRTQAVGRGDSVSAALLNEAADEIRHLLHQFAAGFLKTPKDDLMRRLEAYDHEASRQLEARSLLSDTDLSDTEAAALAEVAPSAHGHLRLVRS
ncbi:MAG: Hpt domain-containing protein, partial [Pseudomonadota bacterium]